MHIYQFANYACVALSVAVSLFFFPFLPSLMIQNAYMPNITGLYSMLAIAFVHQLGLCNLNDVLFADLEASSLVE